MFVRCKLTYGRFVQYIDLPESTYNKVVDSGTQELEVPHPELKDHSMIFRYAGSDHQTFGDFGTISVERFWYIHTINNCTP